MAQRHIVLRKSGDQQDQAAALEQRFRAVRDEFGVSVDFPPEVVAAAESLVPDLPERDETAVPFITIDPPGSMDLDQALFIERDGDGYRVRYAIADVPAFVTPGGPIDVEARKRGQTVYCPDTRAPLHPKQLSEGAASLLPDQVRPAFVWDMKLAADGEGTEVTVYRAMVKSHERLDYEQVQKAVDDGSADENLKLLKEVGEKRIALEAKRGGASLPMPEQEVETTEDGSFKVSFRPLVPAEDWNAQVSLLTGMGAADLMLRGKIGILRTMPPPDPRDVKRFRREAAALGVPWSEKLTYGEFLRTLDGTNPKHLALVHQATTLFRGAGYTPIDGTVPDQPMHSAVANPYAHVTAPLRRLVDRYGLVVCEALASGQDVPEWVKEALPSIPEIMSESDRRANGVSRACTDAVEAAELSAHVGQNLPGSVVDETEKGVIVQILDPAVVGKANGRAKAGDEVKVHVDSADVSTGKVGLSIQS